jgi:hypothetical protein
VEPNGSRRRGALIKYALLIGILAAGVAGGSVLLVLLAFSESSCPQQTSVPVSMRLAIGVVTLLLAGYCVGAGVYLRRSLGRVHLMAWVIAAAVMLVLGVVLEAVIEPSEFCF